LLYLPQTIPQHKQVGGGKIVTTQQPSRLDREANAARVSAMPLREKAACAMFLSFVRIETTSLWL
jgi:hypothetical protein